MKWIVSLAIILAMVSCQNTAEKKSDKVEKVVLEEDEYMWVGMVMDGYKMSVTSSNELDFYAGNIGNQLSRCF